MSSFWVCLSENIHGILRLYLIKVLLNACFSDLFITFKIMIKVENNITFTESVNNIVYVVSQFNSKNKENIINSIVFQNYIFL